MRIDRRKLKGIKKAFKDAASEEAVEKANSGDTNTVDQSSISDIKVMIQQMNDEDDDIKIDDKKSRRKIMRSVKAQACSEKNVKMSWNLDVGDTISWKNGDDIHIGMIIKKRSDQAFKSEREARYGGAIFVMTSGGSFWLNPKNVTMLD